jgi:hypothetical protein
MVYESHPRLTPAFLGLAFIYAQRGRLTRAVGPLPSPTIETFFGGLEGCEEHISLTPGYTPFGKAELALSICNVTRTGRDCSVSKSSARLKQGQGILWN